MTPIDLSRILSKYKKGWIAVSPKDYNLVATGDTLREVLNKSTKRGFVNPSVFKAAPVKNLFAGLNGLSLR